MCYFWRQGFSSHTKLRTLLVPIYLIFTLAIGSVGGYFLGIWKNGFISTSHPMHLLLISISTQPFLSPTKVSQVAVPTNWITYADLENGFSLDYPSTWSQLILANHVVAITPHIPQPFYASDTFQVYPGVLIKIDTDNDKGLSATGYVRQKVINVNDYSRNAKIKAKLPGVDGVIVTGLTNPQSGEDIKLTAYIANSSNIIEISFDPTHIENGEHIFNHMLSTIKLWIPQKLIR